MFGKVLDLFRTFDLKQLVFILCLVIGAAGGFPRTPDAIRALTGFQIIQWLLVFGVVRTGTENIYAALLVTALMLVVYKVLSFFNRDDDLTLV